MEPLIVRMSGQKHQAHRKRAIYGPSSFVLGGSIIQNYWSHNLSRKKQKKDVNLSQYTIKQYWLIVTFYILSKCTSLFILFKNIRQNVGPKIVHYRTPRLQHWAQDKQNLCLYAYTLLSPHEAIVLPIIVLNIILQVISSQLLNKRLILYLSMRSYRTANVYA